MLFRQLFDSQTSSYTYLLGDVKGGVALLIDPVREQLERDLALLGELGLRLTHVFETHVHADHVTSAGVLRERTGCRLVVGEGGAPGADLHVRHGDIVRVGHLEVEVLATPGHTDDSVSYRCADRVFTGDALLVRTCGRTDFQNGSAAQLYDSITRVLFSLPDDVSVFPGHDYKGHTQSSIGEEKRFNARVAGRDVEAFVALMNGLHLPRPRNIDEAVPANRACGLVPPLPPPMG